MAWIPLVVAAAPVALQVAGTVMSAMSQRDAGEAAAIQAQNQQTMVNYNAQVARRRAEAERRAGKFRQVRQAYAAEWGWGLNSGMYIQ